MQCPTCESYFDTSKALKAHHQHHDIPYADAKIQSKYGMEPDEYLEREYWDKQRTLKEIGNDLEMSVGGVADMMERHGVDRREQSEVKKIVWENTDNPDKFLKEAHEKTRQMVENGEHNFQDKDFEVVQPPEVKEAQKKPFPKELREWRENNKDKIREYASRGADAREENGMKGMTGQDNPNWRGGKSIYDAVKKQLPGRSWRSIKVEAKKEDGYYCQNCGAIGTKIDSHHIIPIMAGGTNEKWNLISLCESCHTSAEHFMRQFEEFDPVLVE